MTLKLHNTPTHKTEEFSPLHDNEVMLYTCGPTVYDYPHVGNWVANIYWDTLVRTLLADGYKVKRVMNITDVGHLTSDADEGQDKLEKGAQREGKTAWDVAKYYTQSFLDGMRQLNMIMPDYLPRATEFIPQQLELIRKLKAKGYTYQIDDGIYFDTSKFPAYANFANLDLEAQKAGARVEYNIEKRNPSDFALWKFTPMDEKRDMEWETPVDLLDPAAPARVARGGAAPTSTSGEVGADRATGPADSDLRETADGSFDDGSGENGEQAEIQSIMGFPGWHLECSTMAMELLGPTIDIHTGGIDHIPVHHTNEIAQSESASGQQFSRYWIHCNHLKSNGTKISKSLGNGYTLDDLARRGFSPLDFRMFVLQGHYSNEGNFTFENLEAAHNRLQNWRAIAGLRWQVSGNDEAGSFDSTKEQILAALNDNLNTPEALRIVDETFAKLENTLLENISTDNLTLLLKTIDDTLGLQLIESTPDIDQKTKQMIAERDQARAVKDWATADTIRDKLQQKGIALRDTTSGSIWEYTDK
jgi:cysteinyl-tRNA synthetase